MTSTRCAACKYLRRRCPSDCIFSPYFPSNNPQRFAFVHIIYGASNIGRVLRELPDHLRADAADSLYYEAQCRTQNPVYGCPGIISALHQQIHKAQSELARAQTEIAILRGCTSSSSTSTSAHAQSEVDQHQPVQYQQVESSNIGVPISFNNMMTLLPETNSSVGLSTSWFY